MAFYSLIRKNKKGNTNFLTRQLASSPTRQLASSLAHQLISSPPHHFSLKIFCSIEKMFYIWPSDCKI
jgi:hypothetical protein